MELQCPWRTRSGQRTSTANNDRAYQYDAIGNRQKTTAGLLVDLPQNNNYSANALNQYTNIEGATPSYDLDGNATSYPLPAMTGGNATLVWDAERCDRIGSIIDGGKAVARRVKHAMPRMLSQNRLIEVKDGTTTVATYQYDYLGRRISKTAAGTMTRYMYDGWNVITDYTSPISNSSFVIRNSYIWGMDLSGSMHAGDRQGAQAFQSAGGVGGLLAVRIGSSDYYPTFDGNGNVSEYLDTTGTVVAHYEYDPFGNTIVSTGTKKDDFTHRCSTKPLDAETGLYYYGYRFYDPVTGRWPSRDPIEEGGGFNLYGFVGNDGVNDFDILGNAGFGNRYGLPENFWNWYHRQEKCKGYPDIGKKDAEKLHEEWKEEGEPNPEGSRTKPTKEDKERDEVRKRLQDELITGKLAIEAERLRATAELAENLRDIGVVVVAYPIGRVVALIRLPALPALPRLIPVFP